MQGAVFAFNFPTRSALIPALVIKSVVVWRRQDDGTLKIVVDTFNSDASVQTEVDADRGQRVGSHIRMSGSALGVRLFLDETVTAREPPRLKTWQTVGSPELLVIGEYQMGIAIEPAGPGACRLRVLIDYALPRRRPWLGRLFGAAYAKWCVARLAEGAMQEFGELHNGTRAQ